VSRFTYRLAGYFAKLQAQASKLRSFHCHQCWGIRQPPKTRYHFGKQDAAVLNPRIESILVIYQKGKKVDELITKLVKFCCFAFFGGYLVILSFHSSTFMSLRAIQCKQTCILEASVVYISITFHAKVIEKKQYTEINEEEAAKRPSSADVGFALASTSQGDRDPSNRYVV
jgi:hypothetical protein